MIQAKVIADSICYDNRITTLEVVMPRMILAEFNTHRMLSRNSASSRAIPFKKMVQMVEDNPFVPIAWQKDHKGMQGTEYFTGDLIKYAEVEWRWSMKKTLNSAKRLNLDNKVTKQLCNRLLEPFMWHKVIVTATEWENFFNLRCPQYSYLPLDSDSNDPNSRVYFKSKKDYKKYITANSLKTSFPENNDLWWFSINKSQAEIHIQAVAEAIWDAMNESTPVKLKEGDWHIPYGDDMDDVLLCDNIADTYSVTPMDFVNYARHFNETRVQIAVARCARLSYQTLGDNPVIDYKKDIQLYDMLSESGHWSPFEHVAQAMTKSEYNLFYKGNLFEGIEHYHPDIGWCNNFRGFKQLRYTIENAK